MSTTAQSAMKHLTQRRATEVALHNEKLTRERVDALETKLFALDARVTDFAQWKAHRQVADGTFWGRLRWLFTGK